MASARPLRKSSRMSSPQITLARETETPLEEPVRARENKRASLDSWTEPPLRTPAPSFEEHRGLERHGVLEHMAPLGQTPTPKSLQKLRLVQSRPQRSITSQNGDEIVVSNGHARTETASPAEGISRPESTKSEERTMRATSARQRESKEEDDDYMPAAAARPVPAKARQSLPSAPVTPRTQARLNQAHFATIAQNAINQAEASQQWGIALGIKHLYDDSAQNSTLLNVLDAVLHKHADEKQTKVFHRYIRGGKKELARVVALANGTETKSDPKSRYQPAGYRSKDPSLNAAMTVGSTSVSPSKPGPSGSAAVPSPRATRSEVPSTNGAMTHAAKVAAANGISPKKLRSPRTRRSGSVSSSSSLSSAKSLDAETFAPAIDVEAQGSDADAKAGKANQRHLSSKAAAKGRSAPGAGAQLGRYSLFPNSKKLAAQKRQPARDDPDFNQEEQERQKRRLREEGFHRRLVYDNDELDERTKVAVPADNPYAATATVVAAPVVHPLSINTIEATPSPTHSHPPAETRTTHSTRLSTQNSLPQLRNGTSRKRTRDELESLDSPVPAAPDDPASGTISRTGTPKPTGRPAKQLKKSARVMVSPHKNKNGGVTAGMARAGGSGLQASVGNGAEDSSEGHENWDFCSACSGNGRLLCCDGCPRSFHFACLDPPQDPDHPPQGQWFCHVCEAAREPGFDDKASIFSRLKDVIHASNPQAFNLPPRIREYYEGVRTGEEGEFEEVGLPRTNNESTRNARGGYTEEPDLKKLRDAKGNLIICTRCGLSSDGKREIIACDFCPAKWHLDCLDPPLASAPRRTKNGDKPHHSWKCPNHTDQILAELDREQSIVVGQDLSKPSYRMPKRRKPKNSRIVDVALRRGFHNNGIVEIDSMSSDEDEFKEKDMLGTVYRLPEKGIRLDFIDRVKRSWYEDQVLPNQVLKRPHQHLYVPTVVRPHKVARPSFEVTSAQEANAIAALRARSFREQQIALNLTQMAHQNPELQLFTDGIDTLVAGLIAEAPSKVTADKTNEERNMLLALREFIDRRLPLLDDKKEASQPQTNGESTKN